MRSESDQNGPMAGLAFDTLAAARRLKKVGMEESHAEAVAESLRDAVTGSVATKQDLNAVEVRLREEVTAVKVEIAAVKAGGAAVEAEITAVEARLRESVDARFEKVEAEIRALPESTDARPDAHGQALDRIERQLERLSADHRTEVRWIVGSALALGGLMVTMLKFVQAGGG